MKKVLVLGATGAMAVYLIPEMLKCGYRIVGVTLEDAVSEDENLTYIKTNALDMDFLKSELAKGYDGIVDFMVYNTPETFAPYLELFLSSCEHYIFFSTYRVYAGESPITENSLRILEDVKAPDFVTYKEYSIYKALEEDMLRACGKNNFTIIRPAITYSSRRFQLVTLEADVLVARMLSGKTVILPEGAMECEATMSWAGDVAKMINAALFNGKAYGETYTAATAEHHKWREVAEIYSRIGGLKYITVSDEEYLAMVSDEGYRPYARQQLKYDRCYNRIIDNSKILDLAGLKQSELISLEDGLRRELSAVTAEKIGYNEFINSKMDEYLEHLGVNK